MKKREEMLDSKEEGKKMKTKPKKEECVESFVNRRQRRGGKSHEAAPRIKPIHKMRSKSMRIETRAQLLRERTKQKRWRSVMQSDKGDARAHEECALPKQHHGGEKQEQRQE